MEINTKLLYKCPYPFVVIELQHDEINILEYNINNSDYKDLKIDEIKKNYDIKEFIKQGMKGMQKEYIYKQDMNKYKFTFSKLEDNKCALWIEIYDNNNIYYSKSLLNLVHEFKTPLNVIFGSIQLINRKIELENSISNEDTLKYVNIINQNSHRILRLINNILNDKNLEFEHKEYNPTDENIIYFVENICESVNSFAVANNIKVTFDTDIEELIIGFDEEKIESVLLNLISNAIKFRKELNSKVDINITHDEELVNISIKDNGIGIEKNKLDEIFRKFVRLNDEKSIIKEGSGIGLSLVQSMIEDHNGHIKVDSEVDRWTEFVISIPNKRLSKAKFSEI